MINKNYLNQKTFNSYLVKNFSGKEKILISLSCGVDSTVLFDLILKSKYFKSKNIHYLFFDHQKRPEGKFEIKKFIKNYKIEKSQYFLIKLDVKLSKKNFQNTSRNIRHSFIKSISQKNDICDIFLGHHLDDLAETFFLRDLQQSNINGLTSIFSKKINSLNFHRPLIIHTKKQIYNYAIKNKIFWSEDRTNSELEFTRNKIRKFINLKENSQVLKKKIKNYVNIKNVLYLQNMFFKKINDQNYEINYKEFNNLTESLKLSVIQSFYYNLRHVFKKPIRKDSSVIIIEFLRNPKNINKQRSVFGGKITSYRDKICLNLI